ncbi:MAG: dihydroxyacetone kinase family protein [Thermoflexales bacterium]
MCPNEAARRSGVLNGARLCAREGLSRATAAALAGVENTRRLVPKRRRASRLGERARGYQDAGATSAWLIIKTIEESLSGWSGSGNAQ